MIDDKRDAGAWAEALKFKAAVNPDHYKSGGIEAIDYIQAKLSPEEFAGYCRGNALKYISRAGRKFTYWSNSRRNFSSEPHSETWSGTAAGQPTAPK